MSLYVCVLPPIWLHRNINIYGCLAARKGVGVGVASVSVPSNLDDCGSNVHHHRMTSRRCSPPMTAIATDIGGWLVGSMAGWHQNQMTYIAGNQLDIYYNVFLSTVVHW